MRSVSWLSIGICASFALMIGLVDDHRAISSAYADEAATEVHAGQSEAVRPAGARTPSGLVALYDFSSWEGPVVQDRSGAGEPLNLRLDDAAAVQRSEGALEVHRPTLIHSDEAASKISDLVLLTGEVSIEAWIRPASANQSGPARIVTLSKSGTERNVTLGQDNDRFDVRLRTTQTSANGIPSLSSTEKSVSTELTHVVYTHDRSGRTRIYVNGKLNVEQTVSGDTSNWVGAFQLGLANELSGDRPWLGAFHLVAIYCRDLLPHEVAQHFLAGPSSASAAERSPQSESASGSRLFESQIAPLLARHCLECHDSTSREGELDLSRKNAALAGGSNGFAIVPRSTADSLVWEFVQDDVMPQDRPPLSPEEKELLRKWIEGGATWSVDVIDPVIYAQDHVEQEVWLRRLTVTEYIETVRSAVGVDIEKEAHEILPPDLRADGFSNTAYNLNIDLGHVEAYARLAEIIVGRMDVEAFAARFSKSQQLEDDNMRELIAKMGKWLLRGPLDDHEITTFRGISTTVASAGGDFDEAVRFIIEAMLQSPRFIYRIENQQGDGTTWPVGEYELASRLSYIIWGGPPDEELMRAADAGELYDRSGVTSQVRRMLEDPRAVERSLQFMRQWLDLDRLANLRPNSERFAAWDAQLAADMREETLAYFQEVVWEQERPLADLLNAQVTFATPKLAELYGLDSQQAAVVEPTVKTRAPRRGDEGLQALYLFDQGSGDIVRDVSGAETPLHLKIADTDAVGWTVDGLEVGMGDRRGASTMITTAGPPQRLFAAIKKSNAVTIEASITPADTDQSGPARIVTLSGGTGQRNFTLGQEGHRYDVRFRTTRKDQNGLPSVSGPSRAVKTRPTHVVYTRDVTGRAKLYIDGQQVAADNADGDLSNWEDDFSLVLANESTNDRPWRGTLHMVAIYSRALAPEEIRSEGTALSRYDLSSVPARGGLLTHGSVLTVGGDEASMVARGLFVLHDLLRGSVKDPPPCVDTTPVPTKEGLTQRGIAEIRIADQTCGGCHSKFEPLAFGLEKFDGIGAFHETDDHGNQLRDDGEMLIPGSDKPVAYESAAELMDLLAQSERVRECLTWKVTQFALGRPLGAADATTLERIHAAAQGGGGTYRSLITAIVLSDLVQSTRTERPD